MRPAIAVLALAASIALQGCRKESCLSGEAGCKVTSPCADLNYACAPSGIAAEARVLTKQDAPPHAANALAAAGDIQLSNDKIVAVIDAVDSPHLIATSGGSLLDLSVRGRDEDGINLVFQATGILPGDQMAYKKMEIVANGPDVAAVQFTGHLFGHEDVFVATRYEVRTCEPGVRIRTEVVNNSHDPQFWALLDGFYWSDRELYPFSPIEGGGFAHKAFNLLTINDVFLPAPFMAASTHTSPQGPGTSYSVAACNEKSIVGFEDKQISGLGLKKGTVYPRDYRVYERFIAVAPTGDVAGAADEAMKVRAKLWGEKYVQVHGRIVREGGTPVGGAEYRASVQISLTPSESATAEQRTPWTQVVPAVDGTFKALVPASKPLFVQVDAFGKQVSGKRIPGSDVDFDLGDFVAPMVGHVSFDVTDEQAQPIAAQAFFVAADEATRTNTAGSLYGQGDTCTPYLGFPHGGSPACNRVLIGLDGKATVDVPAGNYIVYVTAGPFTSLSRSDFRVEGTNDDVALHLVLTRLPLLPEKTVSADLHVHGAPSFDSSIPDMDRVLAFAAASIDVLAATDHDVVGDYSGAMTALGLDGKIAVIPGVETTGHLPYLKVPDSTLPRVIGHWNFWPMTFDPTVPRRGAPDDELIEPGELFARIGLDPSFAAAAGIRQLNHPWADSQFGRDLGFPRAIGMNLTKALPSSDDGTANGMWIRKPAGGKYRNNEYDSQEVMNGSQNAQYLQYRALWFYLNNIGEFHAGTANSDSHGLTDDVLGSPRNVVFADTSAAHFDLGVFDAAVRTGRVLGTNGPVIQATIDGADTQQHTPSLAAFKPGAGASLHLAVRAAPWVPVEEVRIIVNGKLVKTLTNLRVPETPLGADMNDLQRLETSIPLSELLPSSTDGWIVVEAGAKLPATGDIDGDGMPDTTDNNGDGKIDKADVAKDSETGPLNDLPVPTDQADPLFHFATVVPGARPASFTNPFVIDWAGDGFKAPGIGGAR